MKPRHNPTFDEEREIARRIIQKLSASTTRELMIEFNVSRTVISRITRECKVRLQMLKTSRNGDNTASNSAVCATFNSSR